jgi:hypothetical protein
MNPYVYVSSDLTIEALQFYLEHGKFPEFFTLLTKLLDVPITTNDFIFMSLFYLKDIPEMQKISDFYAVAFLKEKILMNSNHRIEPPETVTPHLFGEDSIYKYYPTRFKYCSEQGTVDFLHDLHQAMIPEMFESIRKIDLDLVPCFIDLLIMFLRTPKTAELKTPVQWTVISNPKSFESYQKALEFFNKNVEMGPNDQLFTIRRMTPHEFLYAWREKIGKLSEYSRLSGREFDSKSQKLYASLDLVSDQTLSQNSFLPNFESALPKKNPSSNVRSSSSLPERGGSAKKGNKSKKHSVPYLTKNALFGIKNGHLCYQFAVDYFNALMEHAVNPAELANRDPHKIFQKSTEKAPMIFVLSPALYRTFAQFYYLSPQRFSPILAQLCKSNYMRLAVFEEYLPMFPAKFTAYFHEFFNPIYLKCSPTSKTYEQFLEVTGQPNDKKHRKESYAEYMLHETKNRYYELVRVHNSLKRSERLEFGVPAGIIGNYKEEELSSLVMSIQEAIRYVFQSFELDIVTVSLQEFTHMTFSQLAFEALRRKVPFYIPEVEPVIRGIDDPDKVDDDLHYSSWVGYTSNHVDDFSYDPPKNFEAYRQPPAIVIDAIETAIRVRKEEIEAQSERPMPYSERLKMGVRENLKKFVNAFDVDFDAHNIHKTNEQVIEAYRNMPKFVNKILKQAITDNYEELAPKAEWIYRLVAMYVKAQMFVVSSTAFAIARVIIHALLPNRKGVTYYFYKQCVVNGFDIGSYRQEIKRHKFYGELFKRMIDVDPESLLLPSSQVPEQLTESESEFNEYPEEENENIEGEEQDIDVYMGEKIPGRAENVHFSYKIGSGNLFDELNVKKMHLRGMNPKPHQGMTPVQIRAQKIKHELEQSEPFYQNIDLDVDLDVKKIDSLQDPIYKSLWPCFAISVPPLFDYNRKMEEIRSLKLEKILDDVFGVLQNFVSDPKLSNGVLATDDETGQFNNYSIISSTLKDYLFSILDYQYQIDEKADPNKIEEEKRKCLPTLIRRLNIAIHLIKRYNYFIRKIMDKKEFSLARIKLFNDQKDEEIDTTPLDDLRRKLSKELDKVSLADISSYSSILKSNLKNIVLTSLATIKESASKKPASKKPAPKEKSKDDETEGAEDEAENFNLNLETITPNDFEKLDDIIIGLEAEKFSTSRIKSKGTEVVKKMLSLLPQLDFGFAGFHEDFKNVALQNAADIISSNFRDKDGLITAEPFHELTSFAHRMNNFINERKKVTLANSVDFTDFFKPFVANFKNKTESIKWLKDQIAIWAPPKQVISPKMQFTSPKERYLSMETILKRVFSELQNVQSQLVKLQLRLSAQLDPALAKKVEVNIQNIFAEIRKMNEKYNKGILGLSPDTMDIDPKVIDVIVKSLATFRNSLQTNIIDSLQGVKRSKLTPIEAKNLDILGRVKIGSILEINVSAADLPSIKMILKDKLIELYGGKYILKSSGRRMLFGLQHKVDILATTALSDSSTRLGNLATMLGNIDPNNYHTSTAARHDRYIHSYLRVCYQLMLSSIPSQSAIDQVLDPPSSLKIPKKEEPERGKKIDPANTSFEELRKYPYYLCSKKGSREVDLKDSFILTVPQDMNTMRRIVMSNLSDLQDYTNFQLAKMRDPKTSPSKENKKLKDYSSPWLNVVKGFQTDILNSFKIFDFIHAKGKFTITEELKTSNTEEGEGEKEEETERNETDYDSQFILYSEDLKTAKKVIKKYLTSEFQNKKRKSEEVEETEDSADGSKKLTIKIPDSPSIKVEADTIVKYLKRYRMKNNALIYSGRTFSLLRSQFDNSHKMQVHMFVPNELSQIYFTVLYKVYSLNGKKPFPVITANFSVSAKNTTSPLYHLKDEIMGRNDPEIKGEKIGDETITINGKPVKGEHWFMFVYVGQYGNIVKTVVPTPQAKLLKEIYNDMLIRQTFPENEGEDEEEESKGLPEEKIQARLDSIFNRFAKPQNIESIALAGEETVKKWEQTRESFEPKLQELFYNYAVIRELFGAYYEEIQEIGNSKVENAELISLSRYHLLFKSMEHLFNPQAKRYDIEEDEHFIMAPSLVLDNKGNMSTVMRLKLDEQFKKDDPEDYQINLGLDPGRRTANTAAIQLMYPCPEPYQETFNIEDDGFEELMRNRIVSEDQFAKFKRILEIEGEADGDISAISRNIEVSLRRVRTLQRKVSSNLINREFNLRWENVITLRKMKNIDSIWERITNRHDAVAKRIYASFKKMLAYADTELRDAINGDNKVIRKSLRNPVNIKLEMPGGFSGKGNSKRQNRLNTTWERGMAAGLIKNYCRSSEKFRFIGVPSYYTSQRCSNCGSDDKRGYFEWSPISANFGFSSDTGGDVSCCKNKYCAFSKKFDQFKADLSELKKEGDNRLVFCKWIPERIDMDETAANLLIRMRPNPTILSDPGLIERESRIRRGIMLYHRDRNAAGNMARADVREIWQYNRIMKAIRIMNHPWRGVKPEGEKIYLAKWENAINDNITFIEGKYDEWIEARTRQVPAAKSNHYSDILTTEKEFIMEGLNGMWDCAQELMKIEGLSIVEMKILTNNALAEHDVPIDLQEKFKKYKGYFESPHSFLASMREANKGKLHQVERGGKEKKVGVEIIPQISDSGGGPP